MELYKIKLLLEKYEEGETSLAEEKLLKEYFASGNIDPQFEGYRLMFAYTAKEKSAAYTKEIKLQPRRRKYAFIGIAASVILAVGLFLLQPTGQEQINEHNLGTIEDPEEAYYKTKEALQMVAAVLNTGRQEMAYVEEFENIKNKYIKE